MLHSHELSQFLFHGLAFRSKCEPEIQGRRDCCLHFVLGEDTAGVGNGLAISMGLAVWIVPRPVGSMGEPGVFPGEAEDFGF